MLVLLCCHCYSKLDNGGTILTNLVFEKYSNKGLRSNNELFYIPNNCHNIGTELLLKCKKPYVKMSMLKKVSRENSNGIIFTDGAFLLRKNGGN